MKIKTNKNDTFVTIETEIYQARNGSLIMNWGNKIIILNQEEAEVIAFDINDFDIDSYNKFYKLKK